MSVAEAFGDIASSLAQMAPDKIITLKASPSISLRVEQLITQRKAGSISTEEIIELEQFLALDLFIGLTKARARALLVS